MKPVKNHKYCNIYYVFIFLAILSGECFAGPDSTAAPASVPTPAAPARVSPLSTSLRACMIDHYESHLHGNKAQRLAAQSGLPIMSSGVTQYYKSKAEWWGAWQPESRLVRYILDCDWNSAAHMRELTFSLAKYAAIGLGLWYVIAIIRHHLHKQQKQEELEELICLIKKIDIEHNQNDPCNSSAT